MSEAQPDLRVELLPANGDVIRFEGLVRSLRAELASMDGVEAQFPPPSSVPEGAKSGALASEGALWIFLTTLTGGGFKVAVTAIQAWCARENGRAVKVTVGDRSVEINGRPDSAHHNIVQELLGE